MHLIMLILVCLLEIIIFRQCYNTIASIYFRRAVFYVIYLFAEPDIVIF